MTSIAEILSQELGQKLQYVENVITLIDEGNTIPFIARYRKEMHGTMDDTTLRNLETRLTYLRSLVSRFRRVVSSMVPCISLRYRAIKGMVLPSSIRVITFSTY